MRARWHCSTRCCAHNCPCPAHLAPYLSQLQSWVATQLQKWVVAHSNLSLAHLFSFLFVLHTVKPIKIALLLQRLPKQGKLTKMCILYKNELIFQFVFNYKLSKTGSFTQIFTKIKNKVIYGYFFASKASDASHPQVHLQYLKRGVPRLILVPLTRIGVWRNELCLCRSH